MVKLLCYAKINFVLDLLQRRPDGYHELAMVMQSVSLADELSLRKIHTSEIKVITDKEITPAPQDNLVYKAAELIFKAYPQIKGVEISLKKRIPLAAGLAGGSADCAGVLHGLNKLFKLKLSLAQLEVFANKLGSDIAFCLHGGTMLAQGRGEKLTPLPSVPKFWGLILKPPFPVSTAQVYKLVPQNIQGTYSAAKIKSFQEQKVNIHTLAANIGNDLYPYAQKLQPSLSKYLEKIKKTLPAAVQMSGSGPAIFAFYKNKPERDRAFSFFSTDEIFKIELANAGHKFKIL